MQITIKNSKKLNKIIPSIKDFSNNAISLCISETEAQITQ